MPYQATVYRVFVASPSDVNQERRIVDEVLHEWNAMHSMAANAVLLPVRWETHAAPEAGDRPQSIINRQLLYTCDTLVGVFWTRLGTPTGTAESGTVEEIQAFIDAGRRVLLYFSKQSVEPGAYDTAEYDRLQQFKASYREQGLYDEFSSSDEFRAKLSRHINAAIRTLAAQPPSAPVATEASADGSAQNEIATFLDQYRRLVRRFAARWAAERDSDPTSVEDGRSIVQQTAAELSNLIAQAELPGRDDVISAVQTILVRLAALQRQPMYMDGGNSFRNFWAGGDDILQSMKQQLDRIADASKSMPG